MRKNILILVCALVLFSLFNTTKTNFIFWDNPDIINDYILSPEIPISYDTDISLFGLFTNFFSDLDLGYKINNSSISNESFDSIVLDPISIEYYDSDPLERNLSYLEEEVVDPIQDLDTILIEYSDTDLLERNLSYLEEEVVVPVEEVVVPVEEVVVPIKEVVIPIEQVVVPIEEVVLPIEEVVVPIEEDEVYVKSDKDLIIDNQGIKENAKELILESLDNGTITIDDVEVLLFKHVGEMIKKKHVKEMIKSKR